MTQSWRSPSPPPCLCCTYLSYPSSCLLHLNNLISRSLWLLICVSSLDLPPPLPPRSLSYSLSPRGTVGVCSGWWWLGGRGKPLEVLKRAWLLLLSRIYSKSIWNIRVAFAHSSCSRFAHKALKCTNMHCCVKH